MQVIPAVDVLDGKVVRLERGRFDRVTIFGDSPAAAVAGLGATGAGLVHVVDLSAARSGVPSAGLLREIAATGVAFQVGGGIRGPGMAEAAVGAGAARVVVGSAAVWSPESVAAIVGAVGGDRVVAAIDVAGGRARGSGWEDEGRDALAVARDAVSAGAGRVMVTAVDRDGMMTGPDMDLLETVAGAIAIPVIASGGVGSIGHIRALAAATVEAVIVGRALFEGRFTFVEAVAAAQRR